MVNGRTFDEEYLKKSQRAYLELAQIYNYIQINCFENGAVRLIEDISQDVIRAYKK